MTCFSASLLFSWCVNSLKLNHKPCGVFKDCLRKLCIADCNLSEKGDINFSARKTLKKKVIIYFSHLKLCFGSRLDYQCLWCRLVLRTILKCCPSKDVSIRSSSCPQILYTLVSGYIMALFLRDCLSACLWQMGFVEIVCMWSWGYSQTHSTCKIFVYFFFPHWKVSRVLL